MKKLSDYKQEMEYGQFTLVELLVVIAIISILAGMLLPALENARNAANTVSCANQQKQIMVADQMYANAYEDIMPFSTQRGVYVVLWMNILTGGDFQTYSNYKFRETEEFVTPEVLRCPSNDLDRGKPFGASDGGNGWANVYGCFKPQSSHLSDRIDELGDFTMVNSWNIYYRTDRMKKPSNTPLVADSARTGSSPGMGCSFFVYEGKDTGAVHVLHNYKANLGFADGHVESQGAMEMNDSPANIKSFVEDYYNFVTLP